MQDIKEETKANEEIKENSILGPKASILVSKPVLTESKIISSTSSNDVDSPVYKSKELSIRGSRTRVRFQNIESEETSSEDNDDDDDEDDDDDNDEDDDDDNDGDDDDDNEGHDEDEDSD